MILNQTPDPTFDHVRAARAEWEKASRRLAAASYAYVARKIRAMFGPTAATLVVEHDKYESGSSRITPLLLLDNDRNPLWFNNTEYGLPDLTNYPGVQQISDSHGQPRTEINPVALEEIYDLMEEAYDAAGMRTPLYLADEMPEHFPPRVFLDLNLDQAVEP